MPNIKSAKKRVKVNEAKAVRNKSLRSDLRTAIKKAELALDNGDANRVETVQVATKKIDKAANRGILHRNAAARKKSQLATRLNQSN